jgi:hypothetical protein
MEIYKVKTAKGRTFWSIQLPEADSDEEVLGSQTVTEELLAEIPSIDKTYIILELLAKVRQENVERKNGNNTKKKKVDFQLTRIK